MLVVHVHVRVKPEAIEDFKKACSDNATESLREPGIARFDLVHNQEDPTCFVLVEAYRTAQASSAHKETEHYKKWRAAVEPMMAEARRSVKYTSIFPPENEW